MSPSATSGIIMLTILRAIQKYIKTTKKF